jgi:hypothetical protein
MREIYVLVISLTTPTLDFLYFSFFPKILPSWTHFELVGLTDKIYRCFLLVLYIICSEIIVEVDQMIVKFEGRGGSIG